MPSDNYIKLTALWEAKVKNPPDNKPDPDYVRLYDSLDVEERYAFRLHECSKGNATEMQETDEDMAQLCGSTKAADKLACLENIMGQMGRLLDHANNGVTEMRVTLSGTISVLEEGARTREKINDFHENPVYPKGPTTLQ